MKDIYAKEILSIYLVKKGEEEKDCDIKYDVATKQKQPFDFDPILIAAILVSIFDYCVDLAPEKIQNEFERVTLGLFKEMLKDRHEYISKLDDQYRK